jgi:hypothetical protein
MHPSAFIGSCQPPLALNILPSRFPAQVGGGSAFNGSIRAPNDRDTSNAAQDIPTRSVLVGDVGCRDCGFVFHRYYLVFARAYCASIHSGHLCFSLCALSVLWKTVVFSSGIRTAQHEVSVPACLQSLSDCLGYGKDFG